MGSGFEVQPHGWRQKPHDPTADTEAVFSALRQVGAGIVALFPGVCEVVIHDLSDLERSVVHVEGNVTNRLPGSPMTDLGLRALRNNSVERLLAYTTSTPDGKVLRCSAPFIRDESGKYFAAVCINLDVSALAALGSSLGALMRPTEAEIKEAFSSDAVTMLSEGQRRAADAIGKPAGAMKRADRVRFVQDLEGQGLLLFRKAVPEIAHYLGVSRATVYNYIRQIRTNS